MDNAELAFNEVVYPAVERAKEDPAFLAAVLTVAVEYCVDNFKSDKAAQAVDALYSLLDKEGLVPCICSACAIVFDIEGIDGLRIFRDNVEECLAQCRPLFDRLIEEENENGDN